MLCMRAAHERVAESQMCTLLFRSTWSASYFTFGG